MNVRTPTGDANVEDPLSSGEELDEDDDDDSDEENDAIEGLVI